jgi:hypothetical protein
MATIPSFYSNQNFLNVTYAVDIAIENHFTNLLFKGQTGHIVYASNSYALRKRSDQNNGELQFPFLNYWLRNFEPGPRPWWNVGAFTKGVFIEELSAKVRYAPITLSYEVSYWCKRDDELKFAISEINFDADNVTILVPTISIESINLPLSALLGYSGTSYNPTYNEQDWLDRNSIHTAGLDMSLDTMSIKTNYAITLPTEIEFNMYAISQHGGVSDVIT